MEDPFHDADDGDHAQLRDLVKADGVEHEAEVHGGYGDVSDDGEPNELPERDVFGCGEPRRV